MITIFLDIDGVLATQEQFHSNEKKWHPEHKCYRFDKKCVKVFNDITEFLTENDIAFEIILSSDWKNYHSIEAMNEIFEWNEVNSVISNFTPKLWGSIYHTGNEIEQCRAHEISNYIEHFSIEKYIVIDDLDLSSFIDENFIQTPRITEGIKQTGIKNKIINKIKQLSDLV